MNCWVWIYKISCAFLCLLLLGGVICVFIPQIGETTDLEQVRDVELAKIHSFEQRIQELRDKQHRFRTDPREAENIARTELGWAKRGEIVIRFPKNR